MEQTEYFCAIQKISAPMSGWAVSHPKQGLQIVHHNSRTY